MDGSITGLIDEEYLTIVREDYPDGRVRFWGKADFKRLGEAEVRQRAKEIGLILSIVDTPFTGESLEWTKVHFLRREVP